MGKPIRRGKSKMRTKRIVICASQTPFVHGGAEILVESLYRQLMERGWPVEVVRVPFRWYPKEEILKGYLAWRLLDLTEGEGQKIDLVIATKFPSFVVQHPNKVTWLIQQFRPVGYLPFPGMLLTGWLAIMGYRLRFSTRHPSMKGYTAMTAMAIICWSLAGLTAGNASI